MLERANDVLERAMKLDNAVSDFASTGACWKTWMPGLQLSMRDRMYWL